MKRFILSTLSVVLAASAVASTAQALPQVDSDFKVQTLRLSELDARNKEGYDESYYPHDQSPARMPAQVPARTNPQNTSAEQAPGIDEAIGAPVTPVIAEVSRESEDRAPSITECRQQQFDLRN